MKFKRHTYVHVPWTPDGKDTTRGSKVIVHVRSPTDKISTGALPQPWDGVINLVRFNSQGTVVN